MSSICEREYAIRIAHTWRGLERFIINASGDGAASTEDEFHQSTILSLKEGYGFIKYPPNNVFFHFSSLIDYDFNDLEIGDSVSFSLEPKEDGRMMAKEVFVVEQ